MMDLDERLLNANITGRTRNGAYTSDRGFISQDDKTKIDRYNDELDSEYNPRIKKARNAAVDLLQSATSNLGQGTQRCGGLNGTSGYLAPQRPFLVMKYANLSLPDNYGHYYGYPCNMTLKLSDLSGFTKVKDCHLDGFSCTKTEMDEIETLLKQGIII